MLFFFFLAVLLVLWALSSLTRDQTWSPALEAWSPNHWTAREFLKYIYYFYLSITPCFSLFVQAAITKYDILVCVCVQLVSHVQLFATCQAPLSIGFCRQEYWNGLPFPIPITPHLSLFVQAAITKYHSL